LGDTLGTRTFRKSPLDVASTTSSTSSIASAPSTPERPHIRWAPDDQLERRDTARSVVSTQSGGDTESIRDDVSELSNDSDVESIPRASFDAALPKPVARRGGAYETLTDAFIRVPERNPLRGKPPGSFSLPFERPFDATLLPPPLSPRSERATAPVSFVPEFNDGASNASGSTRASIRTFHDDDRVDTHSDDEVEGAPSLRDLEDLLNGGALPRSMYAHPGAVISEASFANLAEPSSPAPSISSRIAEVVPERQPVHIAPTPAGVHFDQAAGNVRYAQHVERDLQHTLRDTRAIAVRDSFAAIGRALRTGARVGVEAFRSELEVRTLHAKIDDVTGQPTHRVRDRVKSALTGTRHALEAFGGDVNRDMHRIVRDHRDISSQLKSSIVEQRAALARNEEVLRNLTEQHASVRDR
jgi:hypothetical protein